MVAGDVMPDVIWRDSTMKDNTPFEVGKHFETEHGADGDEKMIDGERRFGKNKYMCLCVHQPL